ncbi:telomere replication protein Est3p [[Candida] jaroonii]|uniref:Telomere replication protein Est3p n=1 Tax=[Candida] jaroonii TaxID=467808 RepID=A0ACA9Y5X8_9ASCO|nr:telomere replication protein Est3p [[Candida] jaroonii]
MDKYPLVLQNSWVYGSVISSIDIGKTYFDPVLVKNFVKDNKTVDEKTPILRIFQFLKITKDDGMSAILNDSSHKILCKFTYKCCKEFERIYRQRITFQTLHCLLLINTAHLRFIDKSDLNRDFDTFNVNFDVIVLEVNDCTIFNHDRTDLPLSVEKSLKFIYDESPYKTACGPRHINDEDNYSDDDEIKSL